MGSYIKIQGGILYCHITQWLHLSNHGPWHMELYGRHSKAVFEGFSKDRGWLRNVRKSILWWPSVKWVATATWPRPSDPDLVYMNIAFPKLNTVPDDHRLKKNTLWLQVASPASSTRRCTSMRMVHKSGSFLWKKSWGWPMVRLTFTVS